MKKFWAIVTAIVIIYSTMTPTGALRFAVLRAGYPLHAVTRKTKDVPYRFYTKDNQTAFSLENPPVEKDTQGQLVNWVVTQYGIFYIGSYYGWG